MAGSEIYQDKEKFENEKKLMALLRDFLTNVESMGFACQRVNTSVVAEINGVPTPLSIEVVRQTEGVSN